MSVKSGFNKKSVTGRKSSFWCRQVELPIWYFRLYPTQLL